MVEYIREVKKSDDRLFTFNGETELTPEVLKVLPWQKKRWQLETGDYWLMRKHADGRMTFARLRVLGCRIVHDYSVRFYEIPLPLKKFFPRLTFRSPAKPCEYRLRDDPRVKDELFSSDGSTLIPYQVSGDMRVWNLAGRQFWLRRTTSFGKRVEVKYLSITHEGAGASEHPVELKDLPKALKP